MRLAIMQPYFFPYIGYFQLIKSIEKFIFYDDVAYIKQGWINRNKILLNGQEHLFTLKLNGSSSYKPINEIKLYNQNEKVLKTIIQAYSKAPLFEEVFPLIHDVFAETNESMSISKIAEKSIKKVSQYLNLEAVYESSSEVYSFTKNLKKEDRLIAICKVNDAKIYINSIGGSTLYDKKTFSKNGINLLFIKNTFPKYKQFNNNFISGLSIIDVMMFNSKEKISSMLNQFELI